MLNIPRASDHGMLICKYGIIKYIGKDIVRSQRLKIKACNKFQNKKLFNTIEDLRTYHK